MKGWVSIALGFAAVVAVALWGLGMENLTVSRIATRASIIIASFAVIIIGGPLLERKIIKDPRK